MRRASRLAHHQIRLDDHTCYRLERPCNVVLRIARCLRHLQCVGVAVCHRHFGQCRRYILVQQGYDRRLE